MRKVQVMGTLWAAAAISLLAVTGSAADVPPPFPDRHGATAAPMPSVTDGPVAVLSYNVEDLPWPIASGRKKAAGAIADRLADLRLRGEQPAIVAVQEAFGQAAQNIGRRAGYHYAAFGPAEADRGAPALDPQDRAFAAKASLLKGETIGHVVGSGLAVFSDYPILWSKRVAFPACAGLDCLANKGILATALQLPGAARPLIVIDTHLNSRTASHTPDARSLFAYQRQVDTLRSVVVEMRREGDVVLAGDFNIGAAPARAAYIEDRLLQPGQLDIAVAEQSGSLHQRSIDTGTVASATALTGAKSLLAYARTLAPVGQGTAFGLDSRGQMLSDHLGVERRFNIPAHRQRG